MTRSAVDVVGGGICGLATAYELTCAGVSVRLRESDSRLGGKIRTSTIGGRPVDEGADAFLARVPWGVDLCRELGLDEELVSPAERSAYVWSQGELRRMPPGGVLGVPTDISVLSSTGLISEAGARRAAQDLTASAPAGTAPDRSVGSLIRDRLGDEVFERLVGPLVSGINAGDADRLSLASVTPQLAAAVETGGSLVKAVAAQGGPDSDPDAPVFYALPDGMGRLVDTVEAHLGDTEVCVGTPVTKIDSTATATVITTPAPAAAALVRGRSPRVADLLGRVEYASVDVVTMMFDAAAVDRPLDASGFLVPRGENTLMTACSWSSSKWAHLARPDSFIVRVSAGRDGDDRAAAMDPDQLVEHLVDELTQTMGVRHDPVESLVSRWPDSFPQYRPGHDDLVREIELTLREDAPDVIVTGAAFRGLGIPACIRQGRDAARAIVAAISPV